MVVRTTFPELPARCAALIDRMRLRGSSTIPRAGLMSHGYYVQPRGPSRYHYGVLYTESRLGSLIAIGKGDVPEAHWFRMVRTFPAACDWQTQPPARPRTRRPSAATRSSAATTSGGHALRAVVGRQHVRGADADAGARRGVATRRRASAPTTARTPPCSAATPTARPRLPGVGPVAERHARQATATASTACASSACSATRPAR